MRISLAVVGLSALAHVAFAQSPAQSPSPVGTWRGTSTCLVRPSACNDETVVYRITQMKAADSVSIDGRKIVGGEEQEMGILACRLGPPSGQITCVIPPGIWTFRVRNDSLTGELRRPDNVQTRDVRTVRSKSGKT